MSHFFKQPEMSIRNSITTTYKYIFFSFLAFVAPEIYIYIIPDFLKFSVKMFSLHKNNSFEIGGSFYYLKKN